MRRPFLHIVIVAGCAAVLAGACGSDESTGTAPEPTTTAAPTTPEPTTPEPTTPEPTTPETAAPTSTTETSTTETTTTETTTTAAPSSTSAATTTVPAATVDVLIYGIRDEHLVALGRRVAAATPAAAMDALVVGLTPDEISAGITTMIPADTIVHGVVVDGDEVTVDLSAVFDTGGGSLAITARVAQTVFTLTQFPGIGTVRFAIDGTVVTSLTGEGVMVDGTGRLDWADLIPLILVEQPVPGATVDQPIHVRGMSNTFEAGINYQVLAADRSVLVEGYFMATSGTGTWGTFDADLDPLPTGTAGEVIVRLFEYSAKDGEPVNVTETPVTLA